MKHTIVIVIEEGGDVHGTVAGECVRPEDDLAAASPSRKARSVLFAAVAKLEAFDPSMTRPTGAMGIMGGSDNVAIMPTAGECPACRGEPITGSTLFLTLCANHRRSAVHGAQR